MSPHYTLKRPQWAELRRHTPPPRISRLHPTTNPSIHPRKTIHRIRIYNNGKYLRQARIRELAEPRPPAQLGPRGTAVPVLGPQQSKEQQDVHARVARGRRRQQREPREYTSRSQDGQRAESPSSRGTGDNCERPANRPRVADRGEQERAKSKQGDLSKKVLDGKKKSTTQLITEDYEQRRRERELAQIQEQGAYR